MFQLFVISVVVIAVHGGVFHWMGNKNDHRRNTFSCDSPIDIYDELGTCPIDNSVSFHQLVSHNQITGNQLFDIMSQFCRNHPIALTCLSEVATKCPELDTIKRDSEVLYRRYCNGAEPLDWIRTALDDYEIDRGCIKGVGSRITDSCWRSAIPANDSPSDTPVQTRVELFRGYASELLLCLQTGFQLSEVPLTECGTNIEDVLLAVSVSLVDISPILPMFSPTDDVFDEIKARIVG